MNGTCLTANDCQSRNGSPGGTCAAGYGTCCIISLGCGGMSSSNNTYFTSSGTETGMCSVTICPCDSNVCQLRLEFESFMLAGPSTISTSAFTIIKGTGVAGIGGKSTAVSQKTLCLSDTFSITSPGGATGPTICGINTGQHMIMPMNSPSCNTLNMNLRGGPGSANWRIRAIQTECNSEVRAPDGCTKFFFGPVSHCLLTYNFDGGLHLGNQMENFCIRRERRMCSICYSTAMDMDFDLTTKIAAGTKLSGDSGQCCNYGKTNQNHKGYDCIILPGKVFMSKALQNVLKANEFCGRGKGIIGPNNSVCTNSMPFRINFRSDGFESTNNEASVNNKGFKIYAIQNPC
ncbi:uncharacterized protein [Lepeophtheirus salmonis]|nr:uncharacterized protein LOC121117996 [Lepeophtheirus salmonis]